MRSVLQTIPLRYYFDWHGLENFDYRFDQGGIPQVNYGSKLGWRYNAITTSQYGLYRLQHYVNDSKEEDLRAALACAEWLLDNLQSYHDVHAWVYEFDLDFYGPQAPWISGMAQGQGISLLLRAHKITGDERYVSFAKQAFQPFLLDVGDGGVRDYLRDGTIFYEEFPTSPTSHVLNGHLFALLGVYDYALALSDNIAHQLFANACTGLAKNLELWDAGFWCWYDLYAFRRLASRMYMKVHIQLLNIFYELIGLSVFKQTWQRWQNYLKNPFANILWAVGKVVEKIRIQSRWRV